MTKIKPRVLLIGVLLLAVLCVIADFGFNAYRCAHTVFDSQKWKTDVASRFDMPLPINPGMSKSEVLKLLGKPDYQSETDPDGSVTFVYRVPYGWSGEVKAVRFIDFNKDVVDRLGFDDSGENYYSEDQQVEPAKSAKIDTRSKSN